MALNCMLQYSQMPRCGVSRAIRSFRLDMRTFYSTLSYLAMNHNGTTLLTGTVLLSMLLSPVMRAPGRGRADQCETAACLEAVHTGIQREAEDEYRRDLQAILAHVCQTQDYRIEDQAAKKNEPKAEMEDKM